MLQAKITAANISDKEGALKILEDNEISSLGKVWGDGGYQGLDLQNFYSKRGIDLEIVKRPPGRKRIYNEQWRAEWIPIERSFSILPRRWVVERTFAWMGRNRRLSRDYEGNPAVSASYLYLAMDRLMLRRFNKNVT